MRGCTVCVFVSGGTWCLLRWQAQSDQGCLPVLFVGVWACRCCSLAPQMRFMSKYRLISLPSCKCALRRFSPAIDPNTLFYRLCCECIDTILLLLTPFSSNSLWLQLAGVFSRLCSPLTFCFSFSISFYCRHSKTTPTSNPVSLLFWQLARKIIEIVFGDVLKWMFQIWNEN